MNHIHSHRPFRLCRRRYCRLRGGASKYATHHNNDLNAQEYCFTIQSCMTSYPSIVELVHHSWSFPSWLYLLPAESKACCNSRYIGQGTMPVLGWGYLQSTHVRRPIQTIRTRDKTACKTYRSKWRHFTSSMALTSHARRKAVSEYQRGKQSMIISWMNWSPTAVTDQSVYVPHWQEDWSKRSLQKGTSPKSSRPAAFQVEPTSCIDHLYCCLFSTVNEYVKDGPLTQHLACSRRICRLVSWQGYSSLQ